MSESKFKTADDVKREVGLRRIAVMTRYRVEKEQALRKVRSDLADIRRWGEEETARATGEGKDDNA